ncbi:MAG: choice-of-anchor I family protein, partial [Flammeovirgaceae bacterium]|nr:choice-of-anchor I family protein [Flammeovirgaceae bacterium]
MGSVSIISVQNNFSVTTLDFTVFNGQQTTLQENGYRVFGPDADLAKDTEPEYIAVSDDSQTAWVTLQENNAIAKINLSSKTITEIFPLGFKDYSINGNYIDASDEDGSVAFTNSWPVFGMYLPDAITCYKQGGVDYIITANEGDAREYTGFNELKRISSVTLDPTVFPDATTLKVNTNLGRLRITNTLGDTDDDGDYDELYSFGARSFSIWNGNTGELVYDSENRLEKFVVDNSSHYDDGRSDDKGVEPEGVTIARMGNKVIAFVGMERVQSVAVVDVTNPTAPEFLQLLETGDGPEGVLYIPASESPNGKSLLVVSSENDGVIKIFQPEAF